MQRHRRAHPQSRVSGARSAEAFREFRKLKGELVREFSPYVVDSFWGIRLENQYHLEALRCFLRGEVAETKLERIASLVRGNNYGKIERH